MFLQKVRWLMMECTCVIFDPIAVYLFCTSVFSTAALVKATALVLNPVLMTKKYFNEDVSGTSFLINVVAKIISNRT